MLPRSFELNSHELSRTEGRGAVNEFASYQNALVERVNLASYGDDTACRALFRQNEAGSLFEEIRDVERYVDLNHQRADISDAVKGPARVEALPGSCILFKYDTGEGRSKD